MDFILRRCSKMMRYCPPTQVILFLVLIVFLVAVGQPKQTQAALITQNVTFTASGFQDRVPPTFTITGSFTITYDPSVSIGPTATGLSLTSLSGMTLADTPFEYIETASSPSTHLQVGGQLALTAGLPIHYPDTFRLGYIVDYNTGDWLPTFYGFQINGEMGGLVDAKTLKLSVTTVPLPPSALLFGVGLLGLSAAGLRKWWRT